MASSEHSFDVVSDFDRQELVNAVEQARREIATRYDFKDVVAEIDLQEKEIVILAASDARADAVLDVLKSKLVRRNLSLKILLPGKPEPAARGNVRQAIKLQRGIDEDTARDLNKRIKAGHPKVQVRIQGDELRVSSKDKDNLQAVIQDLRQLDLPVPLQYTNYR
ncbi:MAG TPA: YajQ family cyclic di-GMP-binding protein [Candidatus Nanopelagicaceae bacterium]|nr:YajQ family cyclic di-GMP-binding protein [Candidatus Nanopelagicaceae bacterium]